MKERVGSGRVDEAGLKPLLVGKPVVDLDSLQRAGRKTLVFQYERRGRQGL